MSEPLLIQLLAALKEIPGLSIDDNFAREVRERARPFDVRIRVHVGGRPITLAFEVKKSLYPRDVRQAIWPLREHTAGLKLDNHRDTQPMLVAEAISPGAKDLLRAERVGYFDSGGSLFVPAQGAYIYIDRPPPKSHEKSIGTIFSGRRAQVVHTLLVRDRTWFGVTSIAKEAQVAPSTVSDVLTQLDGFEWLESRGQGPGKERRLQEPGALLDEWAKQQSVLRPPVTHRYYVPGSKRELLLRDLNGNFTYHRASYAFTSEAAAQCYAPLLTTVPIVRARLLAGPAAEASIAGLSARSVEEGANLIILDARSAGELMFREQVDGVWLASPIQVYLDLLRGEGRSKEFAEHLRRERIRF